MTVAVGLDGGFAVKLNLNRKKLRFGGMAVALTAFIIAAVVLFNVLFFILMPDSFKYIDMTSEGLFTLSDECRDLINNAITGEKGVNYQREEYNKENGLAPGDKDYKEPVSVTVYFCDDPDNLTANLYMKYVYETVRDLKEACSFINVEHLNWEYNPSSVQKFMKTGNTINSQSIIVESGSEYRVFTLQNMFTIDPDTNEVWAYNGEKKLAGAILAVTSVDQPIAYITTAHGEAYYDTALLELLEDAGYKLQYEGQTDADGKTIVGKLSDRENNPLNNEDVRLVVVYNPQSDFQTDGVNELDRIDRFLEENNSMMVFMDPYTPVLKNFEEWLGTWGVSFGRMLGDDGKYSSYMLNDTSASLDSAGYELKADYIKTGGLGYSIYSSMLNKGYSPSVIFDCAMPISFTFPIERYVNEDKPDPTTEYNYGMSFANGETKKIYDVFTAPSGSVAIANGIASSQGGTVTPSVGGISYVYRDSAGNLYHLDSENKNILDSDDKALERNDSGRFVAKDGTELEIVNGRIVAVGEANGDVFAIIKEITEYSGKKYVLSDDGTRIVGEGIEYNEQTKQYTTKDGSVLEIETVGGGYKSIKIVSGAQSASEPFKVMTITSRDRVEQEDNYSEANLSSYLLACGSTAFATEKYLKSAVYGNSDVLLSATTFMGRDVVPVGLDFKPFASFDISDITDAEANRYTLLLTILPAVIVVGAGVVVLVRRKHS